MGLGHSTHLRATPVQASNEEDVSPLFRNPAFTDRIVDNLLTSKYRSLWDLFQHGVAEAGPKSPIFSWRKTRFDGTLNDSCSSIDRDELEHQVLNFGSGVIHASLAPKKRFEKNLQVYPPATELSTIGIFLQNRLEWFIAEYACAAYGLVLVPIYSTLSQNFIETIIINETQCTTLVISPEDLDLVYNCKASSCSSLQNVIVLNRKYVDFIPPNAKKDCKEVGLRLITFSEVMELGENNRQPVTPSGSDDVWSIVYTAGTAGPPKGVILTHGNIVAFVCAALRSYCHSTGINTSTIHLSYIPLPNTIERTISIVVATCGGCVAIYSGDSLKLLEDAKILEPTMFVGFPRLFERINDKVVGSVEQRSSVSKYLFRKALDAKLFNLRRYGAVTHAVWDAMVFDKVRYMFGSRLKVLLGVGEALHPETQEYIQIMFCAPLIGGFGLAESTGLAFLGNVYDRLSGHVGCNQPCLEWCVRSVPNFSVHDHPPVGELRMRGASLFKGYFNGPDATHQEALDDDSFFATGDIVRLEENGVTVVERKDNVFKLAGGQVILPSRIEQAYQRCSLVNQIFVYGSPNRPWLVALIVPNKIHVEHVARSVGLYLAHESADDFINHPQVHRRLKHEMALEEARSNLQRYERVREIHCIPQPFAVDNGLCTPSFKLKRAAIEAEYLKVIEGMYDSSRSASKPSTVYGTIYPEETPAIMNRVLSATAVSRLTTECFSMFHGFVLVIAALISLEFLLLPFGG